MVRGNVERLRTDVNRCELRGKTAFYLLEMVLKCGVITEKFLRAV